MKTAPKPDFPVKLLDLGRIRYYLRVAGGVGRVDGINPAENSEGKPLIELDLGLTPTGLQRRDIRYVSSRITSLRPPR